MSNEPKLDPEALRDLVRLLAEFAVREELEQADRNQNATALSRPEPPSANSGR